MKKFFTLLLLSMIFIISNAQTSIPVTNGDFSSGATLSGSSPWTISGWTITQNGTINSVVTGGNAAITTGSSGVISGAITFVGTNSTSGSTNNLNQAALCVESDKIDISSYAGTTSALTFAFQIKVATVTGSAAPWNEIIKVYDASNTDITATAVTLGAKVQGSLKTTAAGTYLSASYPCTLTGNGSPKYIIIQVHLGQIIANTPTLDNFTLTASGAAASTTLTQPVSTALSYEVGNGPSAEQSFQVAGANLGSNNITITPGANIELSATSGSGFASSVITLTPSSGTVATTTLYARLIANQNLGSVGANASRQVNIAATGTTTKTIQFTGTVTGITSSVAGGSNISYTAGAGPSTEKTITVQGSGLTADMVVTPGTNMEISTSSGSGFQNSPVTLTQTAGAVASTPIYTRLKAGLSAGTYNDATAKVTASTTGFTSKEIQFTGTVSATVSATQNISDLTLSGAATLNVAAGGELNINQNSSLVTMTVSPLAKVTLPDNVTLSGSNITLQSDATGTATFVDLNNTSPQTVTGSVKQYVTAERNWYVSSPITAGTAALLNQGMLVQTYSEASKSWSTLAGTDALTAGKGYVSVATVGTGTTGTVSFDGTLNSGTIEVPVTRNESGSGAGYNLVANPYPSYLDWSLVKADAANVNIGSTIWYRTKTAGNTYTFSTFNSSGNVAVANGATTTISKLIPPMQAFWIRVNSGTPSANLTFRNSMRAHKDAGGNTFKAPRYTTQSLIRMQVSNGVETDETLIYFNNNASDRFDSYDSQKMFESNSAVKPEIFTVADNEKLVINGLGSVPENVEIPLGFVAKQTGNYSIRAAELIDMTSDVQVILKDKLLPAIETDLTTQQAYNFNSEITSASSERFSLIFRTKGVATNTRNAKNNGNQVFVNANNQVNIIGSENSNYKIYNAAGSLVEKGILNKGSYISKSLKVGIYVVQLDSIDNNFVSRVIVK